MASIIKKMRANHYHLFYLLLKLFSRVVSDEQYVKWKYFLLRHKRLPLDNPKTFSEKLQWLKLYDRHDEYSRLVDKYDVKDYVAKLIGAEHVVPTYGVYDSFDDIDFEPLPEQFVMKCTHNSGSIVICTDKKQLDKDKARRILERGLKKNPFWTNREYPYKTVKPRIVVEKLLHQEGEPSLRDYKVLCFGGEAKLIELHLNRFTDHHTQDFYDRDWHKTDIAQSIFGKVSDKEVAPPECLDEMLRFSELLTKDMVHCRVDWYVTGGQLYFGELTFFDSSGLCPFDDERHELLLGSWIHLPQVASK